MLIRRSTMLPLALAMLTPPRTVILLFARSAKAEAGEKRWTGNARKDRKLARLLNRETLRVARRTGLPVCHIDEAGQRGAHFGERLMNAVAATLEAGFERLLVIGNDCPQLRTAHLLKAARLLDTEEVVLGPANDGGLYLLGLRASAFEPARWPYFSWQGAALCAEWQRARPDAHRLAALSDLDNAADLSRLGESQAKTSLTRLLLRLVETKRSYQPPVAPLRSFAPAANMLLRAPPLAA